MWLLAIVMDTLFSWCSLKHHHHHRGLIISYATPSSLIGSFQEKKYHLRHEGEKIAPVISLMSGVFLFCFVLFCFLFCYAFSFLFFFFLYFLFLFIFSFSFFLFPFLLLFILYIYIFFFLNFQVKNHPSEGDAWSEKNLPW